MVWFKKKNKSSREKKDSNTEYNKTTNAKKPRPLSSSVAQSKTSRRAHDSLFLLFVFSRDLGLTKPPLFFTLGLLSLSLSLSPASLLSQRVLARREFFDHLAKTRYPLSLSPLLTRSRRPTSSLSHPSLIACTRLSDRPSGTSHISSNPPTPFRLPFVFATTTRNDTTTYHINSWRPSTIPAPAT